MATRRWWEDWREHVALLVSVAVGTVIVLRLLAAANWDSTTAAAILQHAGTTNLVVGAVLASAPLLVTVALSAVAVPPLYRWGKGPERPKRHEFSRLALAALASTLTATVALAGMSLLIWLIAFSFGRIDRNRQDPATARAESRQVAVSVGSIFVYMWFFGSAFTWLPTESIDVEGETTFTGYVLDADSPTWAVLRNDPRQVEFLAAEEAERSICDPTEGWLSLRLWTALDDQSADYPQCPDP